MLGPFRLLLELLSELDDEVVDGAIRGAGLDAPDLVQDLLAAHRLPDALVQEPEQLDLVERELLGLPAARQRMRGDVHAGASDLERGDRLGWPARASDASPQARHELPPAGR